MSVYSTPDRTYKTVEQRKEKLPQYLRDFYATRQLDRIVIDGVEIQGYFEYSYMDEKSYFTSPVRSSGGQIDNLNSYATFLTPRLVIKYTDMHINDYRRLMLLLQSKNEFSVTCYDIVNDTRVTHNMYFATPSMPKIRQRNLEVLGILDYTIELIGTNTDVETYQITYNYNIPDGVSWGYATSSSQTFNKNVSDIVGAQNAQYTDDDGAHNISSDGAVAGYIFEGWSTTADGTGFVYIDGDAYFMTAEKTLYAKWRASA